MNYDKEVTQCRKYKIGRKKVRTLYDDKRVNRWKQRNMIKNFF